MAVDTSCVDGRRTLREPLLLRRFGLRDQEGGWGGVVGSCVDGCRTLRDPCSFVALASGIKRVVAGDILIPEGVARACEPTRLEGSGETGA